MTAVQEPHPIRCREERLDSLFRPRSVAIVGASEKSGKLGTAMLDALSDHGSSAGPTYDCHPVNPRVTGSGFHPTLEAATAANGAPIDLAVMCIPAAATIAAVRDAARLGVGGVLVCSGGFAESGDVGAALQDELAQIASMTGVRILGPNTSGFFRPGSIRASFVPMVQEVRAGGAAVIAASGGMNHALSYLLSDHGVGVALGVGLGNSIDVSFADMLDYAAGDESISAIALHIESVADGRRLLASIRAVTRHKPVVALVVGRSDVSAFAESHTGSLATGWRTTRALLGQAGAVVVDDERHLVDAMAVLSRVRLAPTADPGVGLVTAQAGPGLLVLDELENRGVRVPALSSDTRSALSELLPPLTFQSNPVDTGRPSAMFGDVLRVTADDPAIDAIAVYGLAESDAVDLVGAISTAGLLPGCPVVAGIGGPGHVVSECVERARPFGFSVAGSPSGLARGVDALVRDARLQYALANRSDLAGGSARMAAIDGRLDESAVKDILDELGIGTPKRRICGSREQAHRALAELSGPVAVKILDATVVHKTEVGGVHLDIRTADDLDAAVDALQSIGAHEFLVEAMASPGIDLIVGARRDAVFGPIVVVGLGGTTTEAIGDIAIRSASLGLAEAGAMVDDLQCATMLNGWRGGPTLDHEEFAEVVVAVAGLLAHHDEIADVEINPLRLTSAGLCALDAVIIPTHPSRTGSHSS